MVFRKYKRITSLITKLISIRYFKMSVYTKIVLLYVLFSMGPVTLSLDSDVGKFKKINNCQQCKILKDSFNNWLEQTSRGKHEGGDVAWEEARLKSYARSEMRLVEIQESLCSELKIHQDLCYALAEEAEQLLEQWWFNDDNNIMDLYTWLCIDNLKHCCPSHHFGENCQSCPRDKNNRICGGNGKCDGEGTRNDNGTCICHRGFSGGNCDDCSKNYFLSDASCKSCHPACDGCYSDGNDACKLCASGWKNESGVCIDVDECINISTCKIHEFCVNKEGTYKCNVCHDTCGTCDGPGLTNCTSCKANNILWLNKCMSRFLQNNILKEVLLRTSLYIFLLVLTIVIFKKTLYLVSLTIILISLFIFYYEKKFEISLYDIFNFYII